MSCIANRAEYKHLQREEKMSGKKIVCMMACAAVSLFGTFAAEPTVPRVSARPGKILIAYYSWSGNTRFAAEQIQKATGGTLFEIKPVKAYPKDYKACVEQARKECPTGFKPELASKVGNMAGYKVVFVGTPNWCGTMAPPVRSFLADYDFSGKTLIPFVTHGGGGMANCERDMRRACPKAAFGRGGAFSGSGIRNAGEKLARWVNEVSDIKK